MARIIDGEQLNIIGENVKRARKKMKLSQKVLAERLETEAVYICRGSISRIESGERTVTDIEIAGLSKVLKIPISKLFPAGSGHEKPEN